jgi:hypothetical protein
MENWKCPSGEEWERYLLVSEAARPKELEEHLKKCSLCRFTIDQLRREYKSYAETWQASSNLRIISLSLFDAGLEGEGVGVALLAAQGNGRESSENAVTLASADQKVILRAVRDAHTAETWLYLLADDPDLYRNALVRPFGLDKEYITDASGRVNLGVIEWPRPEALAAEIHLPKAVFHLEPVKDLADAGGVVVDSAGGDRIQVTLRRETHSRRVEVKVLEVAGLNPEEPLRIAVKGAGAVRILQIHPAQAGEAMFEGPEDLGSIEIYLYQ